LLPRAIYFRTKGSGCPIDALTAPHFEVDAPLANSILSSASYKSSYAKLNILSSVSKRIEKPTSSWDGKQIRVRKYTCTKGAMALVSTLSVSLRPV